MNFNDPIDRRGTQSTKWDRMEDLFGVSPTDGLPMWTADSDYATAPCVIEALRKAVEHGAFGYSWAYPEYLNAIAWWMQTRHNWTVEPDWILTTQGLGNAIALCIDVFSDPGDHIAFFTPVYHEFAKKAGNAGRKVTELPLVRSGDTYDIDLDDAQSRLTGHEKVLLFCSPQNPSGRIWTANELRAVSDFARKNNLLLVADEVHHDLVYPGNTFTAMDVAAPDGRAHTIYLTAASKSFNIAGQRTGNMIIPDPELRKAMKNRLRSLDYDPNALALKMVEAAYSPDGAAWIDAQMDHLHGNRTAFDAGINAIPGLWSMPLQSTYLAWVDFSGAGMKFEDFGARIRDDAKIAASPGPAFGTGGETWMRFNLAAPRATIDQAVTRMQRAFGDLQ